MAFAKTGPYSRSVIPDRPIQSGLRKPQQVIGAKGAGVSQPAITGGPTKPLIDRGELAGLAQEQQAPALAALRRNLQAVRAGRFGSLLERREAIRGATRGTGEALPAIQAGAQQSALAQMQPELQLKMLQFQDELRRRQEAEAFARQQEADRVSGRTSGGGVNTGETFAQAAARMPSIFDNDVSTTPTSNQTATSPYPSNWHS